MNNEALATVNKNEALAIGGIGLGGGGLFRAKPSMLELVQPTTTKEGAIHGQFRACSTNVHFGDAIRVVLLCSPQTQRTWFEGKELRGENMQCFSYDGVQPHPRAKNPPAMFCRNCPKNSGWETWRKTHDPKDLPACKEKWHLLVAERNSQVPYFLDIKGKSVKPFSDAMKTQMAGMLELLLANVRAENKKRGYTYERSTGRFILTPGFVIPEGEAQKPQIPAPNIFDISFTIKASRKPGEPYTMSFSDFKPMKPEDKAEFGQLYMDLLEARDEMQNNANEEAEASAMVTEIQPAPKAEVLQGEVLSSKEPITI